MAEIEIRNLTKTFNNGTERFDALHEINLNIEKGDIYGIIGMSGAGKSTLVRCINMLERPTSGTVFVDGKDMGALNPAELRLARRGITMIFQQFNLLMQRTCIRNICYPMEIAGVRKADAMKRAAELLELVGLPDKADAYPAQLSGGQQQRIAIARALATDPQVLLCDEATSALDPNTTQQILSLIKEINRKLGITVIVITHQMSVVREICNHVAILDKGVVAEEGLVSAVFSAPKSEAARRLVFTGRADRLVADEETQIQLRLVFREASTTSVPLVAKIALDTGVCVSVLAASTQAISDEVFGSLLIAVPRSRSELVQDYLRGFENITVEEVSTHVQ